MLILRHKFNKNLIMKKIVLLLIGAVLAVTAKAQEIQDSIQQPKEITVYAELLGWNTNVLGLGKKATVEVEFGEESWGWRSNDGRNLLVDDNGKAIRFNSMVDAMNYMGARGWTFEAAYVVTVAGQNVIHWLMSKQIHEGESSKDGIKQKRDIKKNKKGKKDRKAEDDKDYIY